MIRQQPLPWLYPEAHPCVRAADTTSAAGAELYQPLVTQVISLQRDHRGPLGGGGWCSFPQAAPERFQRHRRRHRGKTTACAELDSQEELGAAGQAALCAGPEQWYCNTKLLRWLKPSMEAKSHLQKGSEQGESCTQVLFYSCSAFCSK